MVVMNAPHVSLAAFWFLGHCAGGIPPEDHGQPTFLPRERVTMKKRLEIRLVTGLVLLVLLTLLVVKRQNLTAEEAQDDAVGTVVQLKDMVVRHEYRVVAFVGLTALFAFAMWIALRANEGEDKAPPRPGESSASDTTASR
jgi:hypothetical protein